MHRQGSDPVHPSSRPLNLYGLQGTDRTSQEADRFSVASPLTPENEPAFAFPQPCDGSSYYYQLPDVYDLKPDSLPGHVDPPYEEELQPKAGNCTNDMLNYPYTSPQQPVAR
jgi:hypothetical protein